MLKCWNLVHEIDKIKHTFLIPLTTYLLKYFKQLILKITWFFNELSKGNIEFNHCNFLLRFSFKEESCIDNHNHVMNLEISNEFKFNFNINISINKSLTE